MDKQNIHCIAAYSDLYGSYFLTYCGDRSDESIMLIVVCLVLWICPGSSNITWNNALASTTARAILVDPSVKTLIPGTCYGNVCSLVWLPHD